VVGRALLLVWLLELPLWTAATAADTAAKLLSAAAEKKNEN